MNTSMTDDGPGLLLYWSNSPINGYPDGNVVRWLSRDVNAGKACLALGGETTRVRPDATRPRYPWTEAADAWVFITTYDPTRPKPAEGPVHLLAVLRADDVGWRRRDDLVREGVRRGLITDAAWIDELLKGTITDVGGVLAREAVAVMDPGAPVEIPRETQQMLLRRNKDGNVRPVLLPGTASSRWGKALDWGVRLTPESRDALLAIWRRDASTDAGEALRSAYRPFRGRPHPTRLATQGLRIGADYGPSEIRDLFGPGLQPGTTRPVAATFAHQSVVAADPRSITKTSTAIGVTFDVAWPGASPGTPLPAPVQRLIAAGDDGAAVHLFEARGHRGVAYLGEMVLAGTSPNATATGSGPFILRLVPTASGSEEHSGAGSAGEPPAAERPTTVAEPTAAIRWVYRRDARVRRDVLRRAAGRCEHCHRRAPFVDDDERPFLEVHHVRRVADGGLDTPTNAVAICPNCHREAHYGRDRDVVNALLAEHAEQSEIDEAGRTPAAAECPGMHATKPVTLS